MAKKISVKWQFGNGESEQMPLGDVTTKMISQYAAMARSDDPKLREAGARRMNEVALATITGQAAKEQRNQANAARHKDALHIPGVGTWATTAGKHAAAVRDVAAMKASYPDKQLKAIYADVASRYGVTVGSLKNWCSKANKK